MRIIKSYLQLARLDKPAGILLLLWPTLWALWLATHGVPNINLLVIFILGTIITRSAGCVINDIFDRRFDQKVTRTKQRPLATSALSLKQALFFLALLALLGLFLLCQLNMLSIKLGLLAACIACIYPLMKRITYFPQVILGIAFSMGIPMAFAACLNALPARCWILFAIAILWPIAYDTAYALVDAKDDQNIGVKSTALFFKHHAILFIAILQTIIIFGFIALGFLEHLSIIFYGAVALSALLFFYQQKLLKTDRAFAAFLNNQWLGCIIWLGIALGVS